MPVLRMVLRSGCLEGFYFAFARTDAVVWLFSRNASPVVRLCVCECYCHGVVLHVRPFIRYVPPSAGPPSAGTIPLIPLCPKSLVTRENFATGDMITVGRMEWVPDRRTDKDLDQDQDQDSNTDSGDSLAQRVAVAMSDCQLDSVGGSGLGILDSEFRGQLPLASYRKLS